MSDEEPTDDEPETETAPGAETESEKSAPGDDAAEPAGDAEATATDAPVGEPETGEPEETDVEEPEEAGEPGEGEEADEDDEEFESVADDDAGGESESAREAATTSEHDGTVAGTGEVVDAGSGEAEAEIEATADEGTEVTGEATPDATTDETVGETAVGGLDAEAGTGLAGTGEEKNPALAAIASLIIPGAGQFLNDQPQRAIVAFLGAVVLDAIVFFVGLILTIVLIGPLFWLLIPVIHVGIAYDAYNQAEKINRGEVTV